MEDPVNWSAIRLGELIRSSRARPIAIFAGPEAVDRIERCAQRNAAFGSGRLPWEVVPGSPFGVYTVYWEGEEENLATRLQVSALWRVGEQHFAEIHSPKRRWQAPGASYPEAARAVREYAQKDRWHSKQGA